MPDKSELVISMVGDCLIQHSLSVYQGERFTQFIDHLRQSDVSIGNLECAIWTGAESPAFVAGGGRGGGLMATPPSCLEELRWVGLDGMWTANNHSADLGERGIVSTLECLDAVGLYHAGTGRNMTEACAPAYFDTAHGRVALISVSDWGPRGRADLPYPIPHGVIAADQGPVFEDRPGVNLLRFDAAIHVDTETIETLRRASAALGWDESKVLRRRGGGRDEPLVGPGIFGGEEDGEGSVYFMGTNFIAKGHFSFETVPYGEDLERNYRWVREASSQADVVIVGMHQQGAARTEQEPPDHTRIFAHGSIDAGADIFVAHGRGRLGGVERYNDGAIIYGLPGFIRQREQIRHAPLEHLQRWGLPYGSTAIEYLEARDEAEQGRSMPPGFQRTAIYSAVFSQDTKLKEIRVYPGEMTQGSRAQSGRPMAAVPGSEMEKRVLEGVVKRCTVLGTPAEIRDGAVLVPMR